MLAANLSLKNENQLLQNQISNLKQNYRLEMREKDLEITKIEDDHHWRRNSEMKNSESLIRTMDLLQIENMELKRDVDTLREAVELKEDRIRDMQLDMRKNTRIMEDLTNGE